MYLGLSLSSPQLAAQPHRWVRIARGSGLGLPPHPLQQVLVGQHPSGVDRELAQQIVSTAVSRTGSKARPAQ